jgi:hypothetical protein
MMSEDKNEKLPKFDGTGYTLWKRRMDLVFVHHELLDVVEMDPLTINPTAAFLKRTIEQSTSIKQAFRTRSLKKYATASMQPRCMLPLTTSITFKVSRASPVANGASELQKVYRKYEETFANYYR